MSEPNLELFVSGFEDGQMGIQNLAHMSNSDYVRGWKLGDEHEKAYGDEHDDECPLCGINAEREPEYYVPDYMDEEDVANYGAKDSSV